MSLNLKFTTTEKKLVLLFVFLNSFALFVNFFGIRGLVEKWEDYDGKSFMIWTNSSGQKHAQYVGYEQPYSQNIKEFWPIVDFKSSLTLGDNFRGIFYMYDISEFLIYNSIFIGIIILRKNWNKL